MGFQNIQIKVKTDYSDDIIRDEISKKLKIKDFSFRINKKSLDARKKSFIHWQLSVLVISEQLNGENYQEAQTIDIPYKKRKEKAVVVGSGPAGFFAAHVLQIAGFDVTIVERGSNVEKRTNAVLELDSEGNFSEQNNYAFGEGGAGTFSDGKLTSRSKRISVERNFILQEYVNAGAPKEILYMSHPHIGTDNLKKIVANLRIQFQENGGKFLFDTLMQDIEVKQNRVKKIITNNGEIEADIFIMAIGHSAYDTYRMLINRNVPFRTKNFAIGHRIEHKQKIINKAQWGREHLLGVKAAEYFLTNKTKSGQFVYSFCMCPGGTVVPAAAFKNKSVVNGMSKYKRNGEFANAGIVVAVHPDTLVGHKTKPLEILDWMDNLEEKFYNFSNSYEIPAINVASYMNRKMSGKNLEGSYSLGMKNAPLYDMIPKVISKSIVEALKNFKGKIKGFDQGVLMGLENKTSSPLQVIREKNGKCEGFENLYFIGEGSGYAGGIISSAADGVKCAIGICE